VLYVATSTVGLTNSDENRGESNETECREDDSNTAAGDDASCEQAEFLDCFDEHLLTGESVARRRRAAMIRT
jgi:hypothetical protein